MKNAKRIQRDLCQPFSANDLEWRVQASGAFNGNIWCRVLAYITNRAIQQRLDNTVGVFGWKNEFSPLPNSVGNGSLCGISIKADGEWITKYDGADNTQIEATKGGLSGSMKRAAVQFGIGRYLYDVEAHYAEVITADAFKKLQRNDKDLYEKGQLKDKTAFYWKPPTLDAKFLPKKLITPSVVKTIKELAIETETDLKHICDAYGVDEVTDLFADEAGAAVSALVKKKAIKEQQDESDKKD
jgi:hypothetical protein